MRFAPKKENKFRIIGIMTGTSMDGIDVSISDFEYNSNSNFEKSEFITKPKITPIAFEEFEFNHNYKSKIKSLINESTHIKYISALNFYLAEVFADSVNQILTKYKIKPNEIDAIAVHGQTIWHEPKGNEFIGQHINHTFQAINGSALAKLTKIPVIYDFRSGDVALGGQGAPLVPIFDFNYFSELDKNIAVLNIGGIANVTLLNSKVKSKVFAFDTGPGNMLIDFVAHKYFGLDYDKNGELANEGLIDYLLLEELSKNEYFEIKPPKSTGRELFGEMFLESKLSEFKVKHNYEIDKYNLIRTVTEFTIQSICTQITKFSNLKTNSKLEKTKLDKIIVSGGGTNNSFLIERLKEVFESNNSHNGLNILISDELGVKSQSKEAIAFAYLGYLFLVGEKGNLPSVTGASKETILGVIAF